MRIANSTNGEKILYDIYPIEMVEAGQNVVPTITNENISQVSHEVKQKEVFGFKVNEKADVNEDLLEELSIYHPKAQVDSEGNISR